MSAEALGKAVLQDVHEESLAELLLNIRHTSTPPQLRTGLKVLDKTINSYQPSTNINTTQVLPHGHQTGHDYTSDPLHDLQNQYSDDQHPTDVELTQPSLPAKPVLLNIAHAKLGSSSAINHLLSHLAALATLTDAYGGSQGCVVWIDLSNTFNAKSLYRHILKYLIAKFLTNESSSITEQNQPETTQTLKSLENFAKQCLQHVHVIACTSTRQLLQIIQSLPNYLFNLTENQSIDRQCTLIVIDSINQFHWVDQFDAEIARLEGPIPASRAGNNGRQSGEVNVTGNILNELKGLSVQLECVVAYTSHSTSNTTTQFAMSRKIPGSNTEEMTSPAMPSDSRTRFDPFHASALVTLTPTSAAINVPQFGAQMTMEQCLRDREKRSEVVKEGSTKWWFDVKGGGAAVRKENTGFWMRVDSDNINFE